MPTISRGHWYQKLMILAAALESFDRILEPLPHLFSLGFISRSPFKLIILPENSWMTFSDHMPTWITHWINKLCFYFEINSINSEESAKTIRALRSTQENKALPFLWWFLLDRIISASFRMLYMVLYIIT